MRENPLNTRTRNKILLSWRPCQPEISCEGPDVAALSGHIPGSASEGSQVPTQNV